VVWVAGGGFGLLAAILGAVLHSRVLDTASIAVLTGTTGGGRDRRRGSWLLAAAPAQAVREHAGHGFARRLTAPASGVDVDGTRARCLRCGRLDMGYLVTAHRY
jgi:hypothetical protein